MGSGGRSGFERPASGVPDGFCISSEYVWRSVVAISVAARPWKGRAGNRHEFVWGVAPPPR
eukprot:2082770-Lingulodinium_polyedra.AAC.1